MRFPYLAPGSGLPTQTQRAQMLSQANINGAPSQVIGNVRDIVAQPAPRGLQLTWAPPPKGLSGIEGYRVYVGTEKNLSQTINDPGTRQTIVPVTAGQTQNVFVSAFNNSGEESTPIQVQGKAITEAGAPALPGVPVDFVNGNGKATDRGNGLRLEESSTS